MKNGNKARDVEIGNSGPHYKINKISGFVTAPSEKNK